MKNVLVIGGGSIGRRHVRCFQRTGRAKVSLCEPSREVRDCVCREYELDNGFVSLDEVAFHDFDAAVICTPAHLHVPMAIRMAEAGIGIMIEKPLGISMSEIDKLQTLIATKNLPVSVAYTLRHDPAIQAVKQAVDSGRFGKPVQIVCSGGQHFPFYRPAYRETYYARHEMGGGAIQDAITHKMNTAEWLVGPIDRLIADAKHCVLDGTDVEDTVHMMTRHGNVLGSFNLNQYQAANESTITIVCERGSARVEMHHCRWLSAVQPDSDWIVEASFDLQRDDFFVRQADAFLDQLDGKQAAACSIDEGLQTLKVNLAALESVKTGQWVKL